MLVFSAVTDFLVDICVNVIDAIGLAGVFVLMLLESACIPVPSEGTMLFAGFNVSEGEYSLAAVVDAIWSNCYWAAGLWQVDLCPWRIAIFRCDRPQNQHH